MSPGSCSTMDKIGVIILEDGAPGPHLLHPVPKKIRD